MEDAQRAVRYVRHHAAQYNIRADRIGAVGGSSGGHLVLMLGLMDGKGDPQDADPVNRESAKVQCVVARAAPADLAEMSRSGGGGAVTSFIGMPAPSREAGGQTEVRIYREASPISYVTADDPPVLLMHGEADETVPIAQSEKMEAALRSAGVTVKFLRIPGGTHGPTFGNPANAPDYMGEMVAVVGSAFAPGKMTSLCGRSELGPAAQAFTYTMLGRFRPKRVVCSNACAS